MSRSSRLLLLAVALAADCPQAIADEARLAWETCVADGGTTNTEFACDTNAGFHFFTASFVLDGSVTTSSAWGIDATVYVGTVGTTSQFAGDWWRLSSDGCRPGALNISADFTSSGGTCADPFFGTAMAATSPYTVVVTPDRPPHGSSSYGHFRVQVRGNQPAELLAGVEYFAFRIRINHSQTMGTDACSGCCVHQDIMLTDMVVFPDFSNPRNLPNAPYVSWQSESAECEAVPAKSLSLGRLRALYR